MIQALEQRVLLAAGDPDSPISIAMPGSDTFELQRNVGRDSDGVLFSNEAPPRVLKFTLASTTTVQVDLSASNANLNDTTGRDDLVALSFKFQLFKDNGDGKLTLADTEQTSFFRRLFNNQNTSVSGSLSAGTYMAQFAGEGGDSSNPGSENNGTKSVNTQGVITESATFTTPGAPVKFANATSNDFAFDSNGKLWLAFYDSSSNQLKFASRTGGTWSATQTLDANPNTGLFLSLAIDPSNKPGVAYYDAANADLKYAHWNGTAWNIQTVESTLTTGLYPSLVYIGSNPAITYYHKKYGDLKLAQFNGTSWNISIVDPANDSGRFSSLAVVPGTSDLAVAYENTTKGLFKYARRGGATWSIATVDDTISGGGSISLVFDKNDRPTFSYYDAANADLKFARHTGSKWLKSTIVSKNATGLYTNLSYDSSGKGTILFYNKSSDSVWQSTSNDLATWTSGVLFTAGGRQLNVGIFNSTRTVSYYEGSTNSVVVKGA